MKRDTLPHHYWTLFKKQCINQKKNANHIPRRVLSNGQEAGKEGREQRGRWSTGLRDNPCPSYGKATPTQVNPLESKELDTWSILMCAWLEETLRVPNLRAQGPGFQACSAAGSVSHLESPEHFGFSFLVFQMRELDLKSSGFKNLILSKIKRQTRKYIFNKYVRRWMLLICKGAFKKSIGKKWMPPKGKK